MAFIEIKKSNIMTARNTSIHASFNLNKDNQCYLNFYSSGITLLIEDYNISISHNTPLQLFFDIKTGQIAVQLSDNGQFVLKKYNKTGNALRIFSKDLLSVIKEKKKYRIIRSKKYDFILDPSESNKNG